MSARIVVFGATGYTGRLVAERLVTTGARPVLAGRNEARLAELAEALGGLETVRADAVRQNSVFAAVHDGDVVVSTVGPFVRYGQAAVRAAIAAGATYLDSTGEPAFIRRVFEEFDRPARRAGATLMTAMGYDFVPGTLAGALALEQAGEEAVRVDVGYYALGAMTSALSAGTRESLVGATLSDGHAFRGGGVRAVRPAERVRSFTVRGRERAAISVGGAEHYALPQDYGRLREVNVYLGWFGPLARPLQAGTLVGTVALRLPLVRGTLQAAGERLSRVVAEPTPGTTPGGESWVAAEAYSGGGEKLAEVHLAGVDGYAFTAGFMAWAARRAREGGASGPGAVGPLRAFGLAALEEGCREAGLARVPDPAAA